MDMNFGLRGKSFLVLGGGQGMGEATIRMLTSLGAKVAVADREIDRARRVADAVTSHGGTAIPVEVDVLDDDALVRAIGSVEDQLGPLDGMATIVGMATWRSLIDMDVKTWDLDQSRNIRYFFIAAREVARGLLARGAPGSIVCTTSVDGLLSAPNHAGYGAAKAGLINLVKTMANEWSPHGIRVNAVAPGPIVTPRIPHAGDEAEARSMANIPMRRRGTVDDIAKAITFFLSDMSPYVTGQTLAVDGGFLTTYPVNIDNRAIAADGVMGGG